MPFSAKTEGESGFDFANSRGQLLLLEGVRIAFLLAILVVTLAFQAAQPEFVNVDVLLPVYGLLAIQFAVNFVYVAFFDRAVRSWQPTAFLFAIETAFISALIFFTGVNQSIFLFLYLVNIILAGFVFQRRGAVFIALLTSVFFSVQMILGPEIKGQTAFFAVTLNNLAFFAVAALSGFLSEQLNFMGSALKAQGRSLAALQNLNALIVRNMATGLVTVDPDGNALLANRAASEILETERVIEGGPLESILPGMFARLTGSEYAEKSRGAERFDWTYRTPSGERLVLDATAARLVGDDGTASGYVLTFQDLTKVRRLEFAVRQSEKLAAVGQLAAGIAHEIRNPLASISGSIQLLESSLPVARDGEERKLMRIVLREIDRLNGLISEFLAYVRPEQAKDDPVDLSALAREIVDMAKFNATLRQDVKVSLDLGRDVHVSGDRDKLKQAILNVLINAYQSMNETESAEISVTAQRTGDVVRLKIRDRGEGIEEARLRKIFEPFHTTKPRGTGLGLAVTHKVVESHGGKIEVESVRGPGPGQGTEFTFEFPARAPRSSDEGTRNEAAGENGLAVSALASDDFKHKRTRGSG